MLRYAEVVAVLWLIGRRDWDGAERRCRHWLALKPDEPFPAEIIARSRYLKGDLEQAGVFAERAIKENPKSFDMLQIAAYVAEHQRRYADAFRFAIALTRLGQSSVTAKGASFILERLKGQSFNPRSTERADGMNLSQRDQSLVWAQKYIRWYREAYPGLGLPDQGTAP
jgi:hypothetical protein